MYCICDECVDCVGCVNCVRCVMCGLIHYNYFIYEIMSYYTSHIRILHIQTRIKALEYIQSLLAQSQSSYTSSEQKNGDENEGERVGVISSENCSLLPSVGIQWLIGCFHLLVLHCDKQSWNPLQLHHYQVSSS